MLSPALHDLYQAIHQDQLEPPVKFFLVSTVAKIDDEERWELRLYGMLFGELQIYLSKFDADQVSMN